VILERKSALFSIISIIMIGFLAIPVILPHILHGMHIAHIGLHIGGVVFAVFITILAVLAYLKLRTRRMLITSIAFGIFIVAELVLLVDATWPTLYDFDTMSLLEVAHLLTFGTLGMMVLGVFRND